MKKILQSGMVSLFLCLTAPAAAYAGENSCQGTALSAQARTVTEDFIETADMVRRGDMDQSQEYRASFEKLRGDTMEMIGTAMDHAQIPSTPAYTQEDLYILAHVICGEAQPYPDQEQLYVGSVVLNRVNSPSFPGTIKGVVFQPGQYSCTRDGNYYREPTDRNWANAKYLLEHGSVLPGNVIWQSGRGQGKGLYLKTRYHSYCY